MYSISTLALNGRWNVLVRIEVEGAKDKTNEQVMKWEEIEVILTRHSVDLVS